MAENQTRIKLAPSQSLDPFILVNDSDVALAYLTLNGHLVAPTVNLGGATSGSGKLNFASDTAASGGIYFGSDVTLYRSDDNTLKTDDSLSVVGELSASVITGGTLAGTSLSLRDSFLVNYKTISIFNGVWDFNSMSMGGIATLTAFSFSGDGSDLSNLNASSLASGTVNSERLGSGTADSTTYLRGDGTWATPAGSVPGSDTQVVFNDGGSFGGDSGLTFNKTSNALTVAGNLSAAGITITTTETAHSYWRLYVSATVTSNNFSLSEVEFRATPAGVDQASGGSANNTANVTNAANAFDNNNATESSYSGAGPYGIGYTFASPVIVRQVSIRCGTNSNQAPKDFQIQFSDNGTTWYSAAAFASQSWTGSETKLFSCVAPATQDLGNSVLSNVASVVATTLYGDGYNVSNLDASKVANGTLPVARGGTGLTTLGGTNRLLYTSSTDNITSLSTSNSAVLITSSGGTPQWQTSGLLATYGGTGQTSYAVGDILYASTTTALSKLAGVATGNVLISGGVSTAPSWGKVNLTSHVSGALPVGNGGTGVTTLGGTNRLLYTTATDTVSSITTANSSVLVTSAGGVPSWSTTLPAVNGSALTALNASNLSTGTVATARLGSGTADSTTYLRGDGTWATVSGGSGSPAGSSGQVQYNDSGAFAGDSGLTYDASTDTLTAGGLSVTGNNGGSVQIVKFPSHTVWVDMPAVTGYSSGIGTGGAGTNPWIAYAGAAFQWFNDALEGDVCYRNTSGKLLFGTTSASDAQLKLSTAGFSVNCDMGVLGGISIGGAVGGITYGTRSTGDYFVHYNQDGNGLRLWAYGIGDVFEFSKNGYVLYSSNVGAPTSFTGWKNVFYNSGSAGTSYGVGVESGYSWSHSGGTGHKWYIGGTSYATLTTTALTVPSLSTTGSVSSGSISTGTISATSVSATGAVSAASATTTGDVSASGKITATKRFASGVGSLSFASSITPNCDDYNTLNVETLTGTMTVNAPTGTPVDGQLLTLIFTVDSTGGATRQVTFATGSTGAFAYGTDITAADIPTTASKSFEVGCKYHSGTSRWRIVALTRGF